MLSLLNEYMKSRPSWRTVLVWYLRFIAILLLGAGIIHWARITGYEPWRGVMFADMPLDWQAATVFFGVLDLVAAIGLWLSASWGPVMWLFRALSQVVMHTVFQDTFGNRPYEIAFYLLTIALYLVLVMLTERERRQA